MKKLLYIFFIFLSQFSFCQKYNTAENYIIQEIYKCNYGVTYNFDENNRFCVCSDSGAIYLVSESNLISFVKNDSVDKSKFILIITQDSYFIPRVESLLKKKCKIDGFRFNDIIYLQDTPIYIIGGRYYILRKIKYAYIDNIDVFAIKHDLENYYTDDIQTDYVDSTLVSAKKFYHVKYLQYYLFLMELIPNSKKIDKCFWKRRYELLTKCFN